MIWIPERVERLKAAWTKDGLSASQIAVEFGISRSTAIGKIHRLGLSGHGARKRGENSGIPRSKPRPTSPRPSKPAFDFRRDRAAGKPSPPAPKMEKPSSRAEPAPVSRTLLIEQLERHHCRWPEGERTPYTFCGADRVEDMPYCEYHCGVAYSAPVAKRRAA